MLTAESELQRRRAVEESEIRRRRKDLHAALAVPDERRDESIGKAESIGYMRKEEAHVDVVYQDEEDCQSAEEIDAAEACPTAAGISRPTWSQPDSGSTWNDEVVICAAASRTASAPIQPLAGARWRRCQWAVSFAFGRAASKCGGFVCSQGHVEGIQRNPQPEAFDFQDRFFARPASEEASSHSSPSSGASRPSRWREEALGHIALDRANVFHIHTHLRIQRHSQQRQALAMAEIEVWRRVGCLRRSALVCRLRLRGRRAIGRFPQVASDFPPHIGVAERNRTRSGAKRNALSACAPSRREPPGRLPRAHLGWRRSMPRRGLLRGDLWRQPMRRPE